MNRRRKKSDPKRLAAEREVANLKTQVTRMKYEAAQKLGELVEAGHLPLDPRVERYIDDTYEFDLGGRPGRFKVNINKFRAIRRDAHKKGH